MGCASSNPLVDGGKMMEGAKETTDNMVSMGEKAMHTAGETINTGVDHVKHAVETGINTAQSTIGSVVHNIENTIGTAKTNATDAVDHADAAVEDLTNKTSETMDEAISDAKTVLAFEDATTENLNDTLDDFKDELGETVKELESTMEETLHLEDIEQHESEPVVEETIVAVQVPEVKAVAEEEAKAADDPPLTPWEAAADEKLQEGRLKSMDSQVNTHFGVDELSDTDTDAAEVVTKSENYDKDAGGNTSDILLSDTLSIKSYKSEI